MYLNSYAEFRGQTNFLRKFIQLSLKKRGFIQVTPMWIDESRMHPLQPLLLFKGFKHSKNWECNGKIFRFVFFFYFVSEWRESCEKKPFFSLGRKQWLWFNHLVWEFSKKLAFKNNIINPGNIVSETLAKIKKQN